MKTPFKKYLIAFGQAHDKNTSKTNRDRAVKTMGECLEHMSDTQKSLAGHIQENLNK